MFIFWVDAQMLCCTNGCSRRVRVCLHVGWILPDCLSKQSLVVYKYREPGGKKQTNKKQNKKPQRHLPQSVNVITQITAKLAQVVLWFIAATYSWSFTPYVTRRVSEV